MRQWLEKLDACLPGKLGKLGQWLYGAERLLRKKEETTDDIDKMMVLYDDLIHEHKVSAWLSSLLL